ncbi:MAG TPA: cytochrome c oxidase subunit II [Candidatus Binatia bacterium]|nr:cytochrome c oxidase subunit II [Candidatus Binatia bacterium]
MFLSLFLFPPQASTHAFEVDALYVFLIVLCSAVALGVVISMLTFAYRFRRRAGNTIGADIHGNTPLELVWSFIPFVAVMFIFVWGASLYFKLSRPPDNAMEVFVTGKQWMWKIQHMAGRREINELHVPVGVPVKLTMTSEDVIHSFFVPAFRVKADVVPGHYSTTWFEATELGTYHLFCAEYCGTEHSRMIGRVVVMEPAEYQTWLTTGNVTDVAAGGGMATAMATSTGQAASPAKVGEQLFLEKACQTCHLTSPGGIGPQLGGLAGHTVELATGETVTADDAYIRESILTPMAKLVKGYPPVMPTFAGQLSEEQTRALVEYVKSLRAEPGAGEATAVDARQQVGVQ